MILRPRPLAPGIALAAALLAPAAAQDDPIPPVEPTAPSATESEEVRAADLASDLDIRVWGPWRQTGVGDYVFDGRVTITWRGSRIQADRMEMTDGRFVEAEGNVLVEWQGNRITGSRMTYDLELERGTIEDALGQVESDYIFWAKSAEKIGERTVHLDAATVTTCTQPTPYWSFAVSSATITVDEYAHMRNVRLRARSVPMLYLPYLVWPVKEDRALGLLMPEFHSTRDRGDAISQELFIPLGRSADLTLQGRYYTVAGFGGGGEMRFLPNRRGAARVTGFYIDDQVAGRGRYTGTYEQTQEFRNGFRLVADVNVVSDFDYYTDFERELSLVSSPSILARIELSRNGRWSSVNVRELRREQLLADGSSLVQQTLPEIEWRGRSRKLGPTPLYLTYESSVAHILQDGMQQGQPIDADYVRADVFPTLTLPWSPRPWLDVAPRVAYRATHYTQSQRFVTTAAGIERQVVDDSLTRTLFGAGLDITGPKFFRIFETGEGSELRRWKHSIEPRLAYGYQEAYDEVARVLLYDEIDPISGAGNQATYGVVQRLFAKRPRAEAPGLADEGEAVVLPDGRVDEPDLANGSDMLPPVPGGGPQEPLEIASFELTQSRSFDRDVSVADLDGDGSFEATSPYSAVTASGRYNPGPATSLDLRGSYDILYHDVRDVTVSGTLRRRLAQLRFSVVHRNGLGVMQVGTEPDGMGGVRPLFEPREDDTQARITAGLTLWRGKITLLVDGSVDADPAPGQPIVPDKRWRFQYRTQCCTFLFEQLSRDYTGIPQRDDFYFRVDLTGIGKLLDFKY